MTNTPPHRHDRSKERGIGFKSLQERGGKLVFHVFGALTEFERDLIRERTLAGLGAARAKGGLDGRPGALDERKAQMAPSALRRQEFS